MEISVADIRKFKIVGLIGRLDWENARLLDQKVREMINEKCYHIVFNLDEVSFICSGGIGALVYNLNKVKKLGGAIYIISSNQYVNFIFETLKFDHVFNGYLYDTYDDFHAKVVEADDS